VEDRIVNELEPITEVSKPLVQSALPVRPAGALSRFAPLGPILKTALVRTGPMLVYQLNRIGRAGTAGAAMMLFAVIFLVSAILPQQLALSDLERQIQAAHRSGKASETAPVRLSRFMSDLPKRSELPKIVGQVFTLAGAAKVTLDRGRYELSPMRSGHLAQYRMTFPIKGSYPDIRQFIDTVLTAVPSAALEGLRVERKAVGDESVSADLRFAVFVRNDM
jgi:hypothetical protein